MATAATLNSDVDSAREAMLSLNWQAALNLLMPVKLLLSTRPDTMLGSTGGTRYNAKAIDELIDRCQQMVSQQAMNANAGSGSAFFSEAPIRYERG